jgi:SSS family solute:Na+ symporter
MNGVAVSVLVFLFLLVTVLGFAAARWRRADLDSLDEWGLGGRGFGTFIAWFLIGGDLYTAYTFIAVPATLYAGSAVGFFAVPYTIVVYPLIFLFLPRLWSVSHRHGYVTPADFVEDRSDERRGGGRPTRAAGGTGRSAGTPRSCTAPRRTRRRCRRTASRAPR